MRGPRWRYGIVLGRYLSQRPAGDWGALWLERRSPGEGSRFVLELPLAHDRQVPQPAAGAEPKPEAARPAAVAARATSWAG